MINTIVNAYYTEPNHFRSIHAQSVINTNNYKLINKNSFLILWGGEDIGTEIYGQTPNNFTFREKKSSRDILEIACFNRAVDLGIPILGICRGAQLITALTGGSLVQHIYEHGHGVHQVETYSGEVLKTNSCHHQMMQPTKDQHILAWSESVTGVDENNYYKEYEKVPEMVHFPSVNAIGVQGHIEWPNMPKEYALFIENHIKELLL